MPKTWVRESSREADAVLELGGLPPLPRTRLQTVEDLLEQSGRSAAPIRRAFVQSGRGASSGPGPLAAFAHAHDARALDAFLLLHAVASAEPWDCTYPSRVWVRALGLGKAAEKASAQAAVSKTMRRLAGRDLVRVSRAGRLSCVTLLHEDGSGQPYTRPRTKEDPWFNVPYSYWSSGLSERLTLAGKTMYLIAQTLAPSFYLPYGSAPAWYGVSPKTAQRGLAELLKAQLLTKEEKYEVNISSETGWAVRTRYTWKSTPAEPPSPTIEGQP